MRAATTAADSPPGRPATGTPVLPAATEYRRPGEAASIQPLSSLFDRTAHVALDVVALRLARLLAVDHGRARAAHANAE